MSFLRKSADPVTASSIFPTFLQPSTPFRRKSRTSSTDSTSSTVSRASAISNRSSATSRSNPFSYCPTPVPVPVDDGEIIAPTDRMVRGHSSHIHCAKCSTDLCLTNQIISKGFTGRYGRAYLVQGGSIPGKGMHVHASVLPNTFLDKSVPRNLVTGQHTVSDVSCNICGILLGWKYVQASEESQKYKVGKFILETKRIRIGVNWEEEDDGLVGDSAYDDVTPLSQNELKKMSDGALSSSKASLDPVEFDSQDEDECEDLFAGVWSPQLASRRRQRKRERTSRRAAKLTVGPNHSQDSFS